MESPSSISRITKSQIKSSMMNTNNNRKITKIDRSALMDISNDSPIVGLASGSLLGTPSSLVKKRNQPKQTPGSGEALLRGQVKILLQKVEEEGEIPKGFLGMNSPSGVLAPTPSNTPLVPNLVEITGFSSNQDQEKSGIYDQEEMVCDESEKNDVTRALLFDLMEKSEVSDCFSDDASVWSVQVNTSMQDEDEAEEIFEDSTSEEEDYNEYYEDYEENGEELEELCEGLSNMFVLKKPLPEFEGKHTRFVYNSDGEIEGEEVVLRLSPSTPEGKHLRFQDEDEDEDESED